MTSAPLEDVIENPSTIIPPGISELPTFLEITRVIDLAARFKGARTFVEDSSREFPLYYQDVGQHLSKWVAKAPKVKETEPVEPPIPTILSGLNEVVLTEQNGGVSISQVGSFPSGDVSNTNIT